MPRPAISHPSLICLRHILKREGTRTLDVFVVLLVHQAHCYPGYPDSQGQEGVGPYGTSFSPELPPLPEAQGQGRDGQQEDEGVGEAGQVPQGQGGGGGGGAGGGVQRQRLENE